MRVFGIFVGLIFFFSISVASNAWADRRVALVIGNSAYQHVPELPNPENDAIAIGLLFKNIGFDVVEVKKNLGINELRQTVTNFTDTSRDAEIAVVYFAGHGIEVDGGNYLIPVDAKIGRDVDVEDETLSLDRLLKVLEPATKLRLVILDACRENPFTRNMKRSLASRSIGRGLAQVDPTTSDTLIAFAAKAGSTARDGDGPNSPFTSALLRHLGTPDLDLRIALGRVRDEVIRSTGNKQEPFVYGSLGGSTVTLVSLTTGDRVDAPSFDSDAAAARDYEATAKVGTMEAWGAFLSKYPKGLYADLARAQLNKLNVVPIAPSGSPDQKKGAKITALTTEPQRTEKKNRSVDIEACARSCAASETRYCQGIGQCSNWAMNYYPYVTACRSAFKTTGKWVNGSCKR